MWPTRYNYFVDNFAEFPRELFAAAASLPPCGSNTSASRTWVDFYDATGKRLNGFCALGTPGDLNKIWFALESDLIPPTYVYIELNDRQIPLSTSQTWRDHAVISRTSRDPGFQAALIRRRCNTSC